MPSKIQKVCRQSAVIICLFRNLFLKINFFQSITNFLLNLLYNLSGYLKTTTEPTVLLKTMLLSGYFKKSYDLSLMTYIVKELNERDGIKMSFQSFFATPDFVAAYRQTERNKVLTLYIHDF